MSDLTAPRYTTCLIARAHRPAGPGRAAWFYVQLERRYGDQPVRTRPISDLILLTRWAPTDAELAKHGYQRAPGCNWTTAHDADGPNPAVMETEVVPTLPTSEAPELDPELLIWLTQHQRAAGRRNKRRDRLTDDPTYAHALDLYLELQDAREVLQAAVDHQDAGEVHQAIAELRTILRAAQAHQPEGTPQ